MAIESSQALLRQQIAFARLHHKNMLDAQGLPMKRACLQASILCLDLGIKDYLASLLDVESDKTLHEYQNLLCHKIGDSRCGEFHNLFEDSQSWLSTLIECLESLNSLPPKPASASSTSLIASSAVQESFHWSSVNEDTLSFLLLQAEEMLNRHVDFGQEM